MDISLIIGIAIVTGIIVLVFGFRSGKISFKVLASIYLICTIIFLGFTLFIVKDALDFRDGLNDDKSLFLIVDEGYLIGSFELMPLSDATVNSANIVFEKNFIIQKSRFDTGDLENLSDGYYKLFIIHESLFELNLTEQVSLGSYDVSVAELLTLLRSENISSSFMNLSAFKLNKSIDSIQPPVVSELRSSLAIDLFSATSLGEDPTALLTEFKYEKVDIYPNSSLFKILRAIPEEFFDSLIKVFKGA